MSKSRAVCATCGSQYSSVQPPDRCIICDEERQFIGHDGQQWTTAAELEKTRKNTWEELEPGLFAIGLEPKFGIGQRGYLITSGKPTNLGRVVAPHHLIARAKLGGFYRPSPCRACLVCLARPGTAVCACR